MTLLVLVLVALGGSLLAWLVQRAGRGGTAAGVAALAVFGILAAVAPGPAADLTLAGEVVTQPAYARLFLLVAAGTGILIALLTAVVPNEAGREGAARDPQPDPSPAFLGFLGAVTLALAIPSPVTAMVPAAAAGVAAVALGWSPAASRVRGGRGGTTLTEAGGDTTGRRIGVELLRIAVALAAAVTALELLAGPADVIAGEPFAVGAALLALSLAVALSMGTVPFQRTATHLVDIVNRTAQPMLSPWGPAVFAVVALAGLEAGIVPLGFPLAWERGLVAGLAALTIVAGGVGALTRKNLDQLVAYSIVGDSGFVLLAFASTDPAAWGAERTWLLVLPLAKSGLLAWALATGRVFGSRQLGDLGGWARRAPVLAVALAFVTLATIGLPGLLSFEARLDLVRGAFTDPVRSLVFLASLTSAAALVRVVIVGLGQPTTLVQAAPRWWSQRPQADQRRRAGATASLTLELNWVPAATALVLAMSILAACVGAGLFGLQSAAAGDVPAVRPGSQPVNGGATLGPAPTGSPIPSAAPSPT